MSWPAQRSHLSLRLLRRAEIATLLAMTMDTDHRPGNDVPCWMLDADYNSLCFRASHVFFPHTLAWNDLKNARKGDYDETVWDHLAGTKSAAFEAGEHKQIAVKVIDDRGNELLVVKALEA